MPNRWPYSTGRWKRVRKEVLRRDRYTCQECGGHGFEVHHLQPWRKGGAVFDKRNLQVLCGACHAEATCAERGRPRPQWARDWDAAVC